MLLKWGEFSIIYVSLAVSFVDLEEMTFIEVLLHIPDTDGFLCSTNDETFLLLVPVETECFIAKSMQLACQRAVLLVYVYYSARENRCDILIIEGILAAFQDFTFMWDATDNLHF